MSNSPGPRTGTSSRSSCGERSLRDWLGLNPSTLSLLGTIFLVTAATELWSPLIPQYLKDLRMRTGSGETIAILLVGAYGFYRDAL